MCDCFHLAFPNWHGSPGTGAGRRLRGPEHGADDSICDEPSQYIEGERPRPQGSSPVEEYPEKFTDEGDDVFHKGGKKGRKGGFGSLFDKRSTPKMSKLEEAHSPEAGVIVKTAKDGGSEGLIVSGGGKDGIFIKEVVPESPASKSLSVKEGDQILSATVYFDNVTYEDALQILEHAQAYKVKLCLKRKPDITETEPVLQSEAAHGEEGSSPEMRQRGKTKRHSDARISWPKFPSLGRGRKSRFTRSHSSSEADEQRKLELSPTTSDTESPIKTQDALKSKKKHKIKLSGLRKKGRVSSSLDEETDTLTTGPVNGTGSLEASPLHSPDHLESTTGESPQIYVIEDPKVTETSHLKLERDDQSLAVVETRQHKVELINLDSTLKTTDITVALAAQGSPSPKKSPDGKKKKKKEKSEFKMRILGKDKSQKKAEKGPSSPKRLQTLGASIEIVEPTENGKSAIISSVVSHTEQEGLQTPTDTSTQVINNKNSEVTSARSVPEVEIIMPKVDLSLDMSGVGLLRESPQMGKENTQKGSPKLAMDAKEKTDTQTAPTFKLPTVDMGGIVMEETIQKMDVHVEERTTKVKRLSMEGTEVKEDPYERLKEIRLSTTQLPKREDIEIPGMEDVSSTRTKARRIKEPKVIVTGHVEEMHAETLQLAIDVDSVKEAVSKLPGFKLPKVDTSGMPIPEEIIMIDANAQRITVKTQTTPIKFSDVKVKQEAHFGRFDKKGTPEILTRTSVKLPRMTPADLSPHETITETKVEDKNIEYEVKLHQREDIVMHGYLQSPKIEETKEKEDISSPSVAISITERDTAITEEIVLPSLKGSDKKSKKAKMPAFGIAKPDIRFPDVGIELPKRNLSEPKVDKVKEDSDKLVQEMKKSKTEPKLSKDPLASPTGAATLLSVEVPLPLVKSKSTDSGKQEMESTVVKQESKKEKNIKVSPTKPKMPSFKLRKFGNFSTKGKEETAEVRADITMSEPKSPTQDISKITSIDGSLDADSVNMQKDPEKTSDVVVTAPEIHLSVTGKAPSFDSDVTGELVVEEGSKFKLPKFGVSFPKVKGFGVDHHASKPKAGVSLTEDLSKPEKKVPEVDGSLLNVDISLAHGKIKTEKDGKAPESGSGVKEEDVEGQGNKFKLPKFGISLPKVKGPEIDLGLSKKNVDVTLPDVKADIQLPAVGVKEHSAEGEIKGLEGEVQVKGVELKESTTFKMPSFKLPTFGGATPHATADVPYVDEDLHIDRAEQKILTEAAAVDITVPDIEIEGPSVDVKSTGVEVVGKGTKFEMPHFGISIPKMKVPEINWNLSKKDVDVKAEVQLPEVEVEEPFAKVEIKAPEIEVELKDVDGSPSKFKMPAFKLPKFGAEAAVEAPDVKTPKDGATVAITQPSIGIEGSMIDVDVKGTGAELEGKGSKFKMPGFGISMPKIKGPDIDFSLSRKDVDVKLPDAKAEVKLPDVEVPETSADISVPDAPTIEVEAKMKKPGWSLPRFSFSKPSVKAPEVDVNLPDVDVSLPEGKVEVKEPELEIKVPEIEVQRKDADGSPTKFKMPTFKLPKFGIATPKVTVEVSDVDKDIKIDGAELKTPKEGATVDITTPIIDIEGPSMDVKSKEGKLEGKGSKFKMPSFDVSMPKVKGPEIDFSLSKKDVDVTLPEAKAQVKVPDVEIKVPSAKVEIKAPEIEGEMKDAELKGSPSKFKMPSFKLPKLGAATPNVSVEVPDVDKDIHIDGAEIKIPKEGAAVDITVASLDIEGPSIDVKSTGVELEVEGKGSKFKMPSLGLSMPKVKGPDIDFSLSKKDVDVTLPEAKVEVKLPDVEVPETSADISVPDAPTIEVDAKMKKPGWSLPKFSFSKTSVKAPDVDVNLPDVDVSLPEVKVEVKEPGLEIKPPEIEGELDGQGSKFKMPGFGISLPKVKGPEFDFSLSKKDVDVTLPEAKVEVKLPDVEVPETSADISVPDAPAIEVEAKMKKPSWSLPKFSFPKPSVKAPDVDVSLPDVDVSLPEGKVEVKEPELEINVHEIEVELKETEGSPSKFKMPTFKLPKFGAATVAVEIPEVHKDIRIDGAELKLSKEGAAVEIAAPSIDIEGPSLDVKSAGAELEGKGGKFKMPSLGLSMPKVKGPEFDFSSSKKDVDVTLPEVKAEVKLPDVEVKGPSAEAPAVELEAKLKKPRFSLPRFSLSKPSVKGPEADINLPDVDVSLPEVKVKVKEPELEIKPPEIEGELDGQGSKFKMPGFGISLPKVKGPEFDFSLSKKDVDVTLPEAKAEVKLPDVEVPETSADISVPEAPSIEVEAKMKKSSWSMPKFSFSKPSIKGPEVDVNLPQVDVSLPEGKVEVKEPELQIKPPEIEGELDGQGSKFKMPSFGISLPKVKGPEFDFSLSKKDVDVKLPEAKAEVKLPDVEVKEPSAAISVPEAPSVEVEAKMKKSSWSMPTFSFSKPSIKGPEVDVNLPQVDVSLPEGKVEVKEPELEIKVPEIEVELKDTEGSPSKFKMPTFKLPKFGAATPHVSVEVPDVDKDINIKGSEMKIPKDRATVDITAPSIDIEGPSVKSTGAELEGKGGKFKMPSLGLSMPKVKGPEIDLSLSKKDVDVKLPKAKAEVKLPDVKVKETSADISGPEASAIEVDAKMKKPGWSMPKFSFSKPSVKAPEVDVNLPGVDVSLPEVKVGVKEPELEIKPPEIEVELKDVEGSPSKFKMPAFKLPKFGAATPSVTAEVPDVDKDINIKGPEINLNISKKDVHVTLPEPKVEIKAPEVEVQLKDVDGSPSKFKMPTFKLPKFGAATPHISVEVPDVDKDMNIKGSEMKVPKNRATVDITAPSIDIEGPSIDVKSAGAELEGKGGKFKMPSLGLSMPKVKGPEIDFSSSKKDVTLPEVKAEVKLPDVEVKEPSAEAPAVELEAKLKKPRFSLPRFSLSKSSVKEPEFDVNMPGVDVSLPEGKVEVKEPELNIKSPETDIELDGQGRKFKMPGFGISLPKLKGPEIDLSLSKKDVDVTLPEAKVEVKLPDVEVPETSAAISVPEAPAIEVEAKLKKASFSMPRFSFAKSSVKGPEVDVNLPQVDVSLPEGKVEVKEPEVEIKAPEVEIQLKDVDGSPSKFKMPTFKLPRFGAATPHVSVEVPDVDKDIHIKGSEMKIPKDRATVDITAPSIDIEGPSIDVKSTGAELEGKGGTFKMPSLGLSMPKVKGPEIDFSSSKKDVTLLEVKAEVKLPDVEVKEPSAEAPAVELEAKLKKPRFSLPRFSFSKPSVKEAEFDVNIPDVDVSLPEVKVEVKEPELEIKPPEIEGELDGQGSKFKMPSFGISLPKVKGPEFDLSSSKKDVDVTLPEVKAEVKLPDVEVKEPSAEAPAVELEAKLKKPRFSLPRFSLSKSSVKEPEFDVNMPGVDVSLPEGKVEVKEPELDIKAPETDIELDGQGRKFKMPGFGISLPKVKGPEIDLSLSKKDVDVTLPEAKVEVKLPDVEVPETSVAISVPDAPTIEVDAKMKKPSWSLPKFSFSKPSVKAPDVDVNLPDVDVSLPEGKVEVTELELEIKPPEIEVELKDTEGSPSKFKMPAFKLPKFGAATPSVTVEVPDVDKDINIKGPEIDLNLSKKDIDVTLPEVKAEVKLPDVEVKEPSVAISVPEAPSVEVEAKMKKPSWSMPRFSFSKQSVQAPEVDVNLPDVDVSLPEGKVEVKEPELEIKVPEIEVELKDAEGSPSKFKMPTFKLPKFGAATPSVTEEIPELEGDINIKAPEIKTPEKRAIVDITVPSLDIEGPSIDVKTTDAELEGKGGKFKMPNLGLSMPKVKGPEISVSKKDVDVTLPEAKAEVELPDVEVKESSAAISVPEAPTIEVEAKVKKPRFSLPRFSFSKPSVKEPEADVNLPEVDVSLPEGKVEVKQPEVVEVEVKMPGFGISLPKVKGAEIDLSLSKKDVDVTLPEAKAEVKPPESEAELKDSEGSPSRFKMPTFKLPKFGATTPDITVDVPYVDEDVSIEEEDAAVEIKFPSVDIDVHVSNADHPKQETVAIDSEMAKTEAGSPAHGSPSKFKLPSFKMPRLSFSKPKPEDEYVPVPADTEFEDDHLEIQVEPQGPGKSPKLTLTSFGEILQTIDVEFDVRTKDEEGEKRTPSKEEVAVPEPIEFTVQPVAEAQPAQKEDEVAEIKSKPRFKFPRLSFSRSPEESEMLASTNVAETTGIEKRSEGKEKETNIKQESSKSPEKIGWLKFAKFGLSSPSEPAKIAEKEEQESERSPAGDTVDDDVSTTYSLQSSEAFADISSTATSEYVGFSLSSPTKVTVKYSDPDANVGLGEVHGNVVTSTTRTELISVEPNLPEKVTILSSRESSSSVDTLRLESGNIHVITSNIQATPEAQHATRLTDFHVESAGGLSLKPEFKDGASWSMEESRRTESGKRTIVQKHVVRETSAESRETVVITKKVTHVFGVESSEPISDETASSIRRLKDSVHYDKIKFFEDAQK